MEGLLPSEVARLVYGYLEELKCSRAAQEFLESCPLLSECLAAHNNGRRIISRVYGRTLQNIIDDYCDAHNLIVELQENVSGNVSDAIQNSSFLGKKVRVLCDVIENHHIVDDSQGIGNILQQIPVDVNEIRSRSSDTSLLKNAALSSVQSTVNQIQVQTPTQPLVQSNENQLQVQTPTQPLVKSNENQLQVQTLTQPLVQSNENQLQVQTPTQPLVQSNENQLQVQTPTQPLVQSNENQLQVQTPTQPLVQSNENQLQVQTSTQPLVQSNENQLQVQTSTQPLVQSIQNQLQVQTPTPVQSNVIQVQIEEQDLTNDSNPKDLRLESNLLTTPQNVATTSQILYEMETLIKEGSNLKLSASNDEDLRGSPSRKKTPAKFQKYNSTPATSSTPKEKNFLSPEVFIKPMLENTQLHEKIAEAINNAMTSETLNNELNATISSVVEQTQSDPVFQRLVDEMFTLPPDLEDQNISSPEPDRADREALEMLSTHETMESSSSHHRHSLSPIHVPMLEFPMTPLAPSTPIAPNTPADRAINRLGADNELNTPDNREVSRKSTSSVEVSGITERSPNSNEIPLKARLRSSCKKNDPFSVITSKVVAETITPDVTLSVFSTVPPAQEKQVIAMEVDKPEKTVEQAGVAEQIQQQQSGNLESQNADECFIVDDGICVEMAPEVEAAFSKGSAVVLSQSNNTRDILELAMTNSNLTPTVPRLMGGMQLVRQAYLQRAPAKIPSSNFVFVNQISSAMHQPIAPSHNIYLPEHAPFMPLTSPMERSSQTNRYITIAPKTPLQEVEEIPVRNIRRRTSRLGKSRLLPTMPPDRKIPDRNIKIIKDSNKAQPTSSLINVPRVQHVSQETIEAMVCPPPPAPTTPVKSILSMPSISPLFLPSDFQDTQLQTYNVAFVPEQSETSAVDPSAVDSSAISPSAVDPSAADPNTVDSSSVDLSAVDPNTVDSSSVDLSAVEVSEAAVADIVEEEGVAEVSKVVPEPEAQPSTSNAMEFAERSTNQAVEMSTNKVSQQETTQENVIQKKANVESTNKAISPKVKDSSVVRTFQNPRRQSLSTPRRDRNHVRTLDFSTPPRKGATPRRAHTSPKGRGSQRKHLLKTRFSPSTAKKLSKAAKIVRAGLFQSPDSCVNSSNGAILSTLEETNQESNIPIKIASVIEEFHTSPPSSQIKEKSTKVSEIEETDTVTNAVATETELNTSDIHNSSTETSSGSSSTSSSSLNTSTSSSVTSCDQASITSVESPLKSPQHASSDVISNTNTKSVVTNKSAVCGIATRTPGGPTVTKSCWDKVTGVELILGNAPVLTPSPVKTHVPTSQQPIQTPQCQQQTPLSESPQCLQGTQHQDLPQSLQLQSVQPEQQQELASSLQTQESQHISPSQEKQPLPQKQIPPKRKIVKDWDSDLRELVTKQSRETLMKSAEVACDKIVTRKTNELHEKLGLSLSDISSDDDDDNDAFESPKRKDTKKKTPVCNLRNKSKSKTKSKSFAPKNKKQSPVTTVANKKTKVKTKKSSKKSSSICQEDEDVVVDCETEQDDSEQIDVVTNPTDQIEQGMTLVISTDELCSTSQKEVVQSPRTVTKHVMHSEIQVSSNTNSPKRTVDMNNLLAVVAQSSCLNTPQKLDVSIGIPNPLEETPLTKLLREQPPHELTVIDTPVFPVTPNCDLLDSQCASPPSPNESPYYPPPRDTYDIQFEVETVSKQRKTTSSAATVEIQSARTSRSKSKKDKLNSSGDSNTSNSSSTKKFRVPSAPQIISVEQLLAAEQNRIGLKKASKRTKKTKITKEPVVKIPTKITKEPKDRLRANNLYSDIDTRPVAEQIPIFSPSPPVPDDEVDMHDFNEEEEQEDTALQQEKEIQFRELLDEKKKRMMQKLKRDFCKKEMPVVHLRVEGSKQNKTAKSNKGVNKTPDPQPSTSKTTSKESPEKPAMRQQPLRASKTQAKASRKVPETAKQQSAKKNLSDAVQDTSPVCIESNSFLRKILTATSQCNNNQITESVVLVQQTLTESVSTVVTSQTTDVPTTVATSQITDVPTTVATSRTIDVPAVSSSSSIQTSQEREEVQKVEQISPQKLKSLSVSPRKSISVDEIANRLRSAVGLSDDEDMPPLVLQDSPVNSLYRPVRLGTPQKCCNILKQLELSPYATRTRQEKTVEQPHKINESEKSAKQMSSEKQSDISPPAKAVVTETRASDDELTPATETVVEAEESNPVTSIPPEVGFQQISAGEPEINYPENIIPLQETSPPQVQTNTVQSQPANPSFKKVGCYNFEHDESVKYPDLIPSKGKAVTITLDCILDEGDGKGEQQKTVKISTTETYELLVVKPQKSRLSAENHLSSSSRRNESTNSSRQYYTSHRNRDNSRYTSHRDRRSRSHSPRARKSGRKNEDDRYERRPSDSSRNRRSRSSSDSHNSKITIRKRRHHSRSHHRSRERYERRDVRHGGEREHRHRQHSDERERQDRPYSSGREARDNNIDKRDTERHAVATKHNMKSQRSDRQQTAGNVQHTSAKRKFVEATQTVQFNSQANELANCTANSRERSNSISVSPDHRSPRFSSPSSALNSDSEDRLQHSGGESPPLEDDLMTYALVGSERVAEPNTFELQAAPRPAHYSEANLPVASQTNKRKATALENVPPAKKLKDNPQEMLREVGLDNLLSALHGDTDT